MSSLSLNYDHILLYHPLQARDFAPDTGMLDVCRHSVGPGIRVDGYAYPGMVISPHFDSLLVKYTASHKTWDGCIRRMRRALRENHIRGVKTNIPFLLNGEFFICVQYLLSGLHHL
jgi:pyruvate carboxylase